MNTPARGRITCTTHCQGITMSCYCEGDVLANVQRLQALIALETTLDDELDELERQYSLNLLKIDWLHRIGHKDLCSIIAKNMDKTESLLQMYRPMLQNACAEKMELIRSIMESQDLRGGDSEEEGEEEEEWEDHGHDVEMVGGGVGDLSDTRSEFSEDDEFGMRYT